MKGNCDALGARAGVRHNRSLAVAAHNELFVVTAVCRAPTARERFMTNPR
jgi:hypothetical protein